MIGSNRTFDDINLFCRTDLADDFTQSETNVFLEDLLSVFGAPDNVILTVIDCVGGAIVACHILELYTESLGLEARGFPPGGDSNNSPKTNINNNISHLKLVYTIHHLIHHMVTQI